MFDKLEDLLIRFEEIMGELNEPTVTSNQDRFRKLMKEQSDLNPIVEAYKEYKKCKLDIEDSLAMLEEENYGTLEAGKFASFFTADEDIFSLSPEKLVAVRPVETYYKGRLYKEKTGSLTELAAMFMRKAKKV